MFDRLVRCAADDAVAARLRLLLPELKSPIFRLV